MFGVQLDALSNALASLIAEIGGIQSSWGLYLKVGFTTGAVLAFAFCVGKFNYEFLTCGEFDNAGLKIPSNCKVRSSN